MTVYSEMLLQVSLEYSGIPDPRSMTLDQIRFFYDGLRRNLRRMTERKEQR